MDTKTYCPSCNSTAVYAIRHYSDCGSTNRMYRINDSSCYPNEKKKQNEYGDINFFACSDCYHEWF